jgi:uncharacterized protein YecT (DUF1311 family)
MNLCAGLNLQKSDRELNRVYQILLPTLTPNLRQKLKTAQLKWIQFRDDECAFAGSKAAGGSLQPLLIASCKDNLTRQRTTDLTSYVRGKPIFFQNSSYRQADRTLNQRYQQLRQTLSPQYRQQLETAELSWIAYRNSACEFEASRGQGDFRTQCLIRLTEQRTQQLINYLNVNP